MKEIYTKIFIVLFFAFCSFSTIAQRSSGLAVQGKISVEEGSADGAIIQMFRDGKRLDNYGVGAEGKYKVELNYNHKYELVYQHEGHYQQKIVIETPVPKEVLNSDPRFPPFPVDINLFKEIPGIDNSFSENTILKIFYSPSVDNFVSELYYNDAQIKKLIEQATLHGEVVDKRADYMSKLTRAELAELRKEYNKLLEQAGKEYSNEQFLAALDGYKAASAIFREEQFPKDRIAEINDLLGLMMAAEDLDKAMLERFNTLVKEGDSYFGQRKYADSKNSYSRALSIKPFDEYVNDQLKIIADIQRQQVLDQKYDDLIAKGDKSIKELLYNEALKLFQDALKIKPEAQYPKTKIDEINGLLADQQKDLEKKKSYEAAMFEAEKQFSKQFYDRALTSFELALTFKPGDEKATKRIEDIKKIMADILNQMNYDKFVDAGDKAYKRKAYSDALSNYEEALLLYPEKDPRIKKRAEEIKDLLYKQKSLEEFVAQANAYFDEKNYLEAKKLYERALALDAENKHVQERLAEIAEILKQQGVDEQFKQLVAAADNLLNEKAYEEARTKYNEALVVKPKEKYPKDKIAGINEILAGIEKTNREYQNEIVKGDGLFRQEKYEEAKNVFAGAGKLKPEETYPKEMIAKIDGLIREQELRAQEAAEAEAARLAAIQAEKDKNYADAIAKADGLFNNQEYAQARNEYRTALDVKPDESYPQEKITEIGNILAQLSAAQKAYEEAVAKADREFKREAFETAITAYKEAKEAKPEESYPEEQLAKIDSIVSTRARLAQEAAEAEAARLAAIQAEKDKNYADAIAKADGLFNNKEYAQARNEYRTALDVKPEESYPQEKITEIGNILAQLSATQKAYEEAVARADREFRREAFETAITAYKEAKEAKPEESYPDEQLAKIDSIVSTRARLAQEAAEAEAARLAAIQAEKDKNYADAIAKADALFSNQEYAQARNEYRTALDVKPEESYPQEKITEIGNILAQLSAAQKAYEEAVAKADREFKREAFENAIAAYKEAKEAKPEESYPEEQLAKIDSIVSARARLAQEAAEAEAARLAAIQAEKDKNYADAIAKGDALFNNQEYAQARNEYRTALDVKPEESYPQEKITEIGNILAQLSAAQKAYEEAVARADREFKREAFETAIAAYKEAKEAKPEESYPDEQLAKIDSIVSTRARLAQEAAEAEAARLAAIQAEKDKNYADAIAKADGLFNNKEYEQARNEYRTALDVKPEESYPQEKITEIGNILAQLSATQKAYEEAVAKADREFKREAFETAITAYKEAKEAKPEESYPDEQLAKIDSIVSTRARLAQEAAEAEAARLAAIQAEKDKNYADAIAKADGLFNNKAYEQARNEYRTALDVKPEESYPQEKITEIDRIRREIAAEKAAKDELDRTYANLIQQADRYFNTSNYNPAKENYQKASGLKPEENYPKEKLVEIEQILAQQALDEKYKKVIVVADGHFRTQEYKDARLQYEIALGVKPDEQYPKSQIIKIDEIFAQEEQKKQMELAAAEDVANRRAQIEKMKEELDEQKILEELGLNALYDELILKADAFFGDKQYNVSRAWYFKARDLKPEETYPPQRIDEINQILNGLLSSQRDREYQRFIDLGDTNFRENELAVARGWYNQALGQKANEQYPKDQLAEIQRRVAERVAGMSDQQVQQFKTTAAKAMEEGNLNVARFWYKKALDLRPEDEEVKKALLDIQNSK